MAPIDPVLSRLSQHVQSAALWSGLLGVSTVPRGLRHVVSAREGRIPAGAADGAVAVREYTPHELTAEEMKNGKTC